MKKAYDELLQILKDFVAPVVPTEYIKHCGEIERRARQAIARAEKTSANAKKAPR